ncbi:nuclear RNA export factor 1-like [Aphidius gifuensis]|uniref:nuclear RNA export factor 1-like n=1 Tax=Aphidius gifuensis TaxID=684658 RepID=UPI001CDD1710|nr:nuclear RNA export factor 1-like [Aphidius gifuensis]
MLKSQVISTWEPLRLTHLKPSLNSNELILASRQDVYHKFIIYQANDCDPYDLLNSIITTCSPEVMLPMNFDIDISGKGTFITKCSVAAIESFVRQGLLISITTTNQIFKIDIVLGFMSINDLQYNQHQIINNIFGYRWDHSKKILNLQNFHNDEKLKNLYCPLSIIPIFIYIIKCFKSRQRDNKLPIRELNLKNNKFTNFIIHEKLFNYTLTKLDLSHNNIVNIELLRYFSEFKITELWLDGNPLCLLYKNSTDYIENVKKIFPFLQKLDGVIIDVERKNIIPLTQQFYLSDNTKINLIKQFVQHYFTMFDQKDRIILNGIYDKDAMFSITIGHISNPKHRQLIKIMSINRNLLKVVDYSRFHKYLLRGPDSIVNTLRKLPSTHHDFKSYSIDILHQTNKQIAMVIQGSFYFREFAIPLSFNRTFIITERIDNEYCIVNDQYHIYNFDSTTINHVDNKQILSCIPKFVPTLLGESEKDDLIKYLSNVTTMNENYSCKLLNKYQWDLRGAISAFIKSYSSNDIPTEAFRNFK